jgi:addiction module RelE/StbE family toxin
MSLPIVLRPQAKDDLLAAREWYERQRPGLGTAFVEAFQELVARIERSPELYGLVYNSVRRCKLRRFPYVVYYRVRGNRIEILTLLHGGRNPEIWRRRT